MKIKNMPPLIRFKTKQFSNHTQAEGLKFELSKQGSFQAQLLNKIQGEFTGRLTLEFLPFQLYSLYFYSGKLIWANGSVHQTRCWYRYMSYYCPEISFEQVNLRQTDIFECWDYHLLTILYQRGYVDQQQVLEVIKSNCTEVLFDIFQNIETVDLGNYTEKQAHQFYNLQNQQLQLSYPFGIQLGVYPSQHIGLPASSNLSLEKLLLEVQQMWRNWAESGLAYCSPNLAPIIKNKLKLQQKTTASIYQNLVTLVNGQRTLRDLAHLMQQDVLSLTKSLTPHVRKQLIGLIKLPDLAKPSLVHFTTTDKTFYAKKNHLVNQVLVAYIDENYQVCLWLENILTKAGYRCLSVQNPVQALPLLLQYNPEVIFLDILMSVINGYEMCAQIRRIARFQITPIILISENIGVVEKMRAKMVGATDFIAKPIDESQLIDILIKYQ